MTRPSSTRTEQERIDDVSLTWMEEWLLDTHASMAVMYGIADSAEVGSRLTTLVVPMETVLDKLDEVIKRVRGL